MEQHRVSRPPHERIGHELVGLKFRCSEVWSGALWVCGKHTSHFLKCHLKKACNDYFFMSARVYCICFYLLKSAYHLSSCLGGILPLHWKGKICVCHPFWVLSWSSSSSMGFKAEFSSVIVHLCHFCICFYPLKSTYHLFPCLGGINNCVMHLLRNVNSHRLTPRVGAMVYHWFLLLLCFKCVFCSLKNGLISS